MFANPCDSGRRVWWSALFAAALLPAVALGQQGADQLASTIEQTLAGIEFRVDLRPEQAAKDLEEQRRRLDLLAKQAPDHPSLPQLNQQFQDLQAKLASGLAGAAKEAATGSGETIIPSAPEEFTAGLQDVSTLQDQAEVELSLGRSEAAAGYLQQAEEQMSVLEQRHAEEIPPGHVPLLVAKERQGALKDQLAQREASGAGSTPAQ